MPRAHASRPGAGSASCELGERAKSDRQGALDELQELFLCGRPAEGISGQTEGILVTWTMHPLADKVIGTITSAWMPWVGKKFDSAQQQGINTLTDSARWPAKILWPLYSTQAAPLGRSAFDFKTFVEPGKLDPSVDVLVIDYAPEMLVNMPGRNQPFAALYFALKSEL